MHARDIPVVGGLVDTALDFISALARIARHPFGFVHTLAFDDTELRRALKFIGAGIAFAYLIISPALNRHGFAVGELLFGIIVLIRLLAVGLLYHLTFLVVGYRKPVTTTLILGSYLNGVYFPFFMAVMLPAYLIMGPQSYFDPLVQQALTPQQVQALDAPLVRVAQIAFLVGYPFFYAVATYWWGKAYGAKLWLSAVLLLVALVLTALVNVYIFPHAIRLFL
jgi:hypothetical protein